MVEKALNYVLFNRFIDNEATIQGYLFIKREVVEKSLTMIRDIKILPVEAVEELSRVVFSLFKGELSEIDDTDAWDLIMNNKM